jgi:DHA1 family bicyclomycin/chloramphenicol resistance-like MFS transporter
VRSTGEDGEEEELLGRRLRQKYLGEKGLIGLIAFLSAFVPLSTDLYLPALPGMAKFFGVSTDLANLMKIYTS